VAESLTYAEAEKKYFLSTKNIINKARLTDDFIVIQLAGGKNNRVFRLKGKSKSYLLKSYFQHKDDTHKRLETEYSFIFFVWNSGIHTVPKPISSDEFNSLALYEFIEGKKLSTTEVREDHIKQAIEFYLTLNEKKKLPEAHQLPNASEACFTIFNHINCVEKRVSLLKTIKVSDEVDRAAKCFIENKLIKSWIKIKNVAFRKGKKLRLNFEQPMSDEEKCLSPSDFGFHNAILDKKGRLRFIDFEYAGWDDPAKLICDFFCQQEVPIDPGFFSIFEAVILRHSPNPELLQKRIRLLFPVYQIKWCCIILNDFIEVNNVRRCFACKEMSLKRKFIQLQKVKQYIQHVPT